MSFRLESGMGTGRRFARAFGAAVVCALVLSPAGCDRGGDAQKNQPPAAAPTEAKPAGDVGEALAAYEKVTAALLKDDYETFIRGVADNGKPANPPETITSETLAKTQADLQADPGGSLKRTKALLQELSGRRPNVPAAKVETKEVRGSPATIVTMPLPDTKELGKKHDMTSRITTDADGNLVIYMVKQGGQWYWNPFGW